MTWGTLRTLHSREHPLGLRAAALRHRHAALSAGRLVRPAPLPLPPLVSCGVSLRLCRVLRQLANRLLEGLLIESAVCQKFLRVVRILLDVCAELAELL